MGIALEETREVLPSVKLPEIGDFVAGHIMHIRMMDDIDPETKEPRLNNQGRPKKVQVLSVMITNASEGCRVGSGDENWRPEMGQEARIFIQGGTWKWWLEAKKGFDLEVGDVLRWKFESVTPNPNKRHNDFKDRKFKLRKPREDEHSNVLVCEQRYRELCNEPTAVDDTPPMSDEIDF